MSRAQLTSTDQQNSGGPVSPFVAGKNKIINGDFSIWQRGTSFSNPKGVYLADRYNYNYDGTGNITISQQSFTPGAAPVAGYESQYFLRINQTTAGSGNNFSVLAQPIENVQTLAGQTVTVSFWAKADTSRALSIQLRQDFGSGGSSNVDTSGAGATLTTSWARYTNTITLPSISGKTIGTGSALRLFIYVPGNTTQTIDLWGVQVEAGSVATPFTTASGTLQGELALCQRYYQKSYDQAIAPATNGNENNEIMVFINGSVGATTVYGKVYFQTSMRSAPSVTIYALDGTINAVTANNSGATQANNTGNAVWVGQGGYSIYNNTGSSITGASTGFKWHYVASAEL